MTLRWTDPQKWFFAAIQTANEILMSGGRKSSKTWIILFFLCAVCSRKEGTVCLILRKNYKDLTDIKNKFKLDICPRYFPNAVVNEDTVRHPNGSVIYMHACERIEQLEAYQGWTVHFLYLNEAAQFAKLIRDKLLSIVVPTGDRQTRIIYDSNPGGIGARWLREEFHEPCKTASQLAERYWQWKVPIELPDGGTKTITRARISSTYRDNFHIDRAAYYATSLSKLTGNLRKMWLDDNWDVVESPFFPDLQNFIGIGHRTGHESVYVGIDIGYACPTVAVFGCIMRDGRLYVFDELVLPQRSEQEIFTAIRAKLLHYHIRVATFFIPPDGWKISNESQSSVAQRYQNAGFAVEKANWDHLTGFLAMRQWLSYIDDSVADKEMAERFQIPSNGKPRTVIDSTNCPNLIMKLQSAEPDPDDPELMKDESGQDEIDALRYLMASMPVYT